MLAHCSVRFLAEFRSFVPLTGDFLTEFFKLCRRKESTDEILGRPAFEEEGKGKTKIHLICVICI